MPDYRYELRRGEEVTADTRQNAHHVDLNRNPLALAAVGVDVVGTEPSARSR